MNKLSNTLLAATALTAAFGLGGTAHAAAIVTTFNINLNGTLNTNNGTPGNLVTATSVSLTGAPDSVSTILTDNTGLISGTAVLLTDPTPLTDGADFTKSFTTVDGKFVESLHVTSVSVGTSSVGIDASGTIAETDTLIGPTLSSSPVFYTAAYTQNSGPGAQIGATFNDSTTPPPPPPPPPGVPEPASMVLLGTALVGLGALRRRRRG